ncbi:MAG: hypothetical protein JEZ02_20025 [Desulfatibacillum sp.]|nr:hypothetical protein [Desulfatibacillum sp.]
MKKYRSIVLLCFMAMCVTSCVPLSFISTNNGGETPFDSFSVVLPGKWVRLSATEYLLLTRDGFPCQGIIVKRFSLENDFEKKAKPIKKGMLPHEQAEAFLDNIKADKTFLNLTVIENAPAALSGKKGFKLVYMYQTESGLTYRAIDYGLLEGDYLYSIQYDAPSRHYFDDTLEVFEQVAGSFKLKSKGTEN